MAPQPEDGRSTVAKRPNMRTRLLDIAEDAVLAKGFAATSIDEIIAEAGITKSGFFYHFSDKNVLARALLQRYIDNEDMILTICSPAPATFTATRCTPSSSR